MIATSTCASGKTALSGNNTNTTIADSLLSRGYNLTTGVETMHGCIADLPGGISSQDYLNDYGAWIIANN
jgi:hypothetical protein